ncbi:sugar phosphate isomerase/epimerase family protein [Draconibacterium halophilum]|uniref:Sugar phosphate isomerase/epimerase n=1 Tax=Draconibacterium halophilum TaxID=2706887 RepID=A0A6C0R9I3_9BACT|nr:sugar phosphate isomerase/epimerase [Draconibacterium halophilum]QIA06566.1 sugar phosphate isomerase/epimerase [Draconibacterium halophilum]
MKSKNQNSGSFSRRSFIGTSAAALTAAAIPVNFAMASPASKGDNPNSNFGGVHIGAITYSWRTMPGGLENIVKYCKECGISSIELMSGDLETYLGAPESPMMEIFMEIRRQQQAQQAEGKEEQQPQRRGRPELSPEQQARMDKYNEEVREFRLNVDMKKVAAAQKLLDDAGIKPHIVKFSPSRWSDEEIDYAFKVAKALGAKGVSEEISEEAAKKLGPIAEKHSMYAVFHQHMQFAEVDGFSYDNFVGISPAVMFNFDSGHYFGSTGKNPCDILRKYHNRIFSIHIKDKTGPDTDPPNQNQVWGQGQTPLEEVLLLIKKEKWPIYCDIELEYNVKPWSNAVKEVKNCVNYARQILM